MYFKVIQECEVEIKKYEKRILDDDKESLKRLIRLNQITSNPKLIDDSYDEISGKEKELEKLLKTIIDRGEKVIVWSSYIGNINYLCKKFIQYSPVKIHGAMTIEDRNKSVEKFKFSEQVKVLFATPQAAKEGLTLTVANNAIFYDRTFNLDDYLQAQDRIHRISQNKICTIYILKIRNSIDEWIEALLTANQYAASLTQGDIKLADYKALADYSYGELIKEILTEGLKNGK